MVTSNRIGRIGAFALPAVPGLTVALYWILSLAGGESLSVAAIYRYGDFNYFPPLAGLSNFTMSEWLVFEHLGEGVRSFPLPSLALHGLLFGLLGPVGFPVADVLVAVAVYFAARRLFRACALSAPVAVVLALVVSCGVLGWSGSQLKEWFAWAPRMHLWGLRFPRPLLTDLFLMLCIGSWLRIFVGRREGLREWAWLGLWLGLLLQSRFYSAATFGLAFGLSLPLLARRPGGVARASRALGVFALAAAASCAPFAVQRLLEHPDIPVRFGAFAVERLRPLFAGRVPRDLLVALAAAAMAGLSVRFADLPQGRERLGAILGLAAMCILSLFALPASIVLLGQTIQPYQFGDEIVTFGTLVLVVAAGQMLDAAAVWLPRQLSGGLGSALGGSSGRRLGHAGLALVAAACLLAGVSRHRPWIEEKRHMRRDFAAYRVPDYRAAFRGLTDELGRERYREARVLATLDIQVLDWWSLFGGMQAFAPDPCATNIADAEIEERLLRLLRELGAAEHDVERLLHDRAVLIFFLGCAKYQMSRGHHFAPLDDYTSEDRRRFAASSPFSSWLMALPESEAERLLERYARTRDGRGDFRLDLIVLGPGPLDRGLAPDPERFRPSFENALFRVYLRADLEPEGAEP